MIEYKITSFQDKVISNLKIILDNNKWKFNIESTSYLWPINGQFESRNQLLLKAVKDSYSIEFYVYEDVLEYFIYSGNSLIREFRIEATCSEKEMYDKFFKCLEQDCSNYII